MVSTMISSISGLIDGKGAGWVDLGVGGVTFRISVPASVLDQLGRKGDTVRLHTSLQVREDSLNLYGFLSEEMRSAFDTLLTINGVGPKVALNILSRFTPDSLALAVDSADTDAFSAVPGIGKKTAGRIVLELKGKLDGILVPGLVNGPGSDEALEALIALGYNSVEARQALIDVPRDGEAITEDRVRQALMVLSDG